MIPKIIHYCWFGKKELGIEEKKCINSWKKKLPGYQIMEWNEDNFDIQNSCEYVRQAYAEKKWAFVSDYARLFALKQYGGIYLDTDVEVLKSFDSVLDNEAFMGVESKYSLCTATIGAEKDSHIIDEFLDLYDGRVFNRGGKIDSTPNSKIIFNYLVEKYGYEYEKEMKKEVGKLTIYPESFFSPINCYTMRECIRDETISVHRYAATWKSGSERFKDKCLVILARIFGEDGREKIKRVVKGQK